MPVHDWTRVPAGTFHDFHNRWIAHITESLNEGLLPKGYYAQSEQQIPVVRPDVVTLKSEDRSRPRNQGGTATAAPPQTRLHMKSDPLLYYRQARRTVVIRHVSGHQIVALIEITSPANKDRAKSVQDFVEKIYQAVTSRVHVLLVDLFPPGPFDRYGLHAELWRGFDPDGLWRGYDPEQGAEPLDKPLLLASYEAGEELEAFLEPVSVGDTMPDMPLFYEPGQYVNVPLEKTYQQAWRGEPEFWRDVIEGRPPGDSSAATSAAGSP